MNVNSYMWLMSASWVKVHKQSASLSVSETGDGDEEADGLSSI